MAINIPTALLRSFVAIVDSGSMLAAADQVFVTQSAVSLQLKRLEDMLQQRLFERSGRRLELTLPGTLLLDYARRVLALHDEAVAALAGHSFSGPVRVGMVQDFAELLLTGVLASFAELNPEAQLFARVAGTADLHEMIARGQLDLAVGFAGAGDPGTLRDAPTRWYGDAALAGQEVVPLVVLERPCRFREAGIVALERAGRRHRIAVETPNLSTLRSAVEAGLGISCRTPMFLRDMAPIDAALLPELPAVGCLLMTGGEDSAAATQLHDLTVEAIRGL